MKPVADQSVDQSSVWKVEALWLTGGLTAMGDMIATTAGGAAKSGGACHGGDSGNSADAPAQMLFCPMPMETSSSGSAIPVPTEIVRQPHASCGITLHRVNTAVCRSTPRHDRRKGTYSSLIPIRLYNAGISGHVHALHESA